MPSFFVVASLRNWAILALVLLLAVLVVRALRGSPFRWFSALLVLTLLGSLCYFEASYRSRESTYTSVARHLAARDTVRVHCQRWLEAAGDYSSVMGEVLLPASGALPEHANLRQDTCRALASFIADPTTVTAAQATAVHVLTHEAMHLTGQASESRAECMAVQRDWRTATLLGAPPAVASRLVAMYWQGVYPRLGDDYLDAQCRDGGTLDENLTHAPWTIARRERGRVD